MIRIDGKNEQDDKVVICLCFEQIIQVFRDIIIRMGSECKSICDLAGNDRELFKQSSNDAERQNCQLAINLKTQRAAPEQYFSHHSVQTIDKLPQTAVIPCQDNVCIIKFPSGITYHGQIDNGQRNGFGTQTWPDRALYVGNWLKNEPYGIGKFTHPSGDYYEGDWVKSKAHGQGKFVKINGDTYTGNWFNDEPSGNGVETTVDGNVYKGQFKNGFKHGKGAYRWIDGSQYDGDWYEGKIEGKGIYRQIDGRFYQGQWKANMMHGYGVYRWPDGRKYQGRYYEDKKEGYGVYYWTDGRRYEGQWNKGKRNGPGRIIFPNGVQKHGFWVDDRREELDQKDNYQKQSKVNQVVSSKKIKSIQSNNLGRQNSPIIKNDKGERNAISPNKTQRMKYASGKKTSPFKQNKNYAEIYQRSNKK